MRKIVLIIPLLMILPAICLASQQPIFEPQKIDNLWYVWAGYDGLDTDIFCSHWDGAGWGKPYQLTDNNTNDLTPAAAIDNNGNPWIVWAGWDGINTSIYCRYYNGKDWSNPLQVDDVDLYADTTPAIVVDKNNTPWITWAGSDGRDDDIYISHWNGKNWSSPLMVNTDDSTPDIMPVVSFDRQNNLILIWCGFDEDRYKLFFSKRIKNNWAEEDTVAQDRFSVDLPLVLKGYDDTLQVMWYEKNICYKALWNEIEWSKPAESEILLPKDFFNVQMVGPAYISWIQDGIFQSIRIIPPNPQKTLVAHLEPFRWIKDILCTDAYAAVEENKYIAFGDSITEGVGGTNNTGYPPRLEQRLDTRIGPSTVVNEGVGGERTIQGLGRIDDVLGAHNARFILIMEGTNDTTWQYSTETITFNLGEMIDHSINYGTTPLLATLPPRQDSLDGRVKDDINPAISGLAHEKGVTLVDQYTDLAKDKDKYMADHLHPNDAGYELMADTWFTAINNILNPQKEDEDDDTGCGVVPPIYRNGKNTGLFNNLLFLTLLFIFILFLKWNNVVDH